MVTVNNKNNVSHIGFKYFNGIQINKVCINIFNCYIIELLYWQKHFLDDQDNFKEVEKNLVGLTTHY